MIICPHCEHNNHVKTLSCEKCGRPFSGSATTTLSMRDSALKAPPKLPMTSPATFNGSTARFDLNHHLFFQVIGIDKPLVIQPTGHVVLGRKDETSAHNPDVDLTPYGAFDKGVSRVHAAIIRNEEILTIVDLGSSNGTRLNGKPLVPDEPRILRDGDEIRLGKLIAHIHFKQQDLAFQ
jgi:hypothetical protein